MNPRSLLVFVAIAGCGTSIGPGRAGVLWRASGGTQPHAYGEGLYYVAPWNELSVYDLRAMSHDEVLTVIAVNGLSINLDASVRYHLDPTQLVALQREIGPEYYKKILEPVLRSEARRVIGRYTPEEIYSTKRDIIEREIREGLRTKIDGKHLVLEAVLIRNVELPIAIRHAIDQKLSAEQEVLKMKYVLEVSKATAEQKRIEAQGIADYNRTVSASLSPPHPRVRADSGAQQARQLVQRQDSGHGSHGGLIGAPEHPRARLPLKAQALPPARNAAARKMQSHARRSYHMLRSLETLKAFDVYTQDRRLGGVYDICFDCHSWKILYLVLDTGRSLFRDPLLIPIDSGGVQIDTSMKRIMVDVEPTQGKNRNLGWLQSATSTSFDDPDYYRGRELVPYCMRATGRPTGHLEDIILDDETWTVRYLVMDTGTVAPRWAVRLDRSQHIGFLEPERPRARA